jgi:hypothetical protein
MKCGRTYRDETREFQSKTTRTSRGPSAREEIPHDKRTGERAPTPKESARMDQVGSWENPHRAIFEMDSGCFFDREMNRRCKTTALNFESVRRARNRYLMRREYDIVSLVTKPRFRCQRHRAVTHGHRMVVVWWTHRELLIWQVRHTHTRTHSTVHPVWVHVGQAALILQWASMWSHIEKRPASPWP